MPSPIGHAPYPGCETGGRPTKYTKEFVDNEAELLEEWMKQPGNIVLNKFATERGYLRQRLTEFCEISEKFSDTFKKAKEWQENLLIENAVTKVFSDGFTKFILINNHGYADKSETKVSGDAANPFTFLLQKTSDKSSDLVKDEEE